MASEWLDNLKVGDKVVVENGSFGHDIVDSVFILTKTSVVTRKVYKFRRKDGSVLGEVGRPKTWLREPTTERLNWIKQANLARKLGKYNWKELPIETLRAIDEMLLESS